MQNVLIKFQAVANKLADYILRRTYKSKQIFKPAALTESTAP
jgi:hypothetical protein